MSTVFDRIHFAKSNHRKSLAILVDPDKTSLAQCEKLATQALDAAVDYFFVGSSILTHGDLDACVSVFEKKQQHPCYPFSREYNADF